MAEPFSLLLPVYAGDSATHFREAFRSSVIDQHRRPDEVVIVRDGPVGAELEAELQAVAASSPVAVNVVPVAVNGGLARALEVGLDACRYDVVARMDADDISLPDRFARQLEAIEAGLDLVGTGMIEFEDSVEQVVGRRVPRTGAAIGAYSRFHDPFNHPTVVYRKQAVRAAGGYERVGLMEDYWLFARMIHTGARVDNIPDALVAYRVNEGAYDRRGGLAQLRAELRLQWLFRRSGFTTWFQFVRNVLVRGSYRLVPVQLRRIAYRRFIAVARSSEPLD